MYIFTAIATILMSGVIATIITYRLNTNRDHIFFMRQKAEELYLAADQYDKILSGYVLTHYPLFKNKITYDELHDLLIAQGKDSPREAHSKMEMLTRVYFPEIGPQLDQLETARGEVNKII